MSFERPYQFFLRAIILLGIVGAFMPREAFDIQLHDTYFVIAFWHAILALCFFFGINMGLYWIFRGRVLTRWMTIFHLVTTLIFILCFIIFGYFEDRYFMIDIYASDSSIFQNGLSFSILIWLLSKFIFVLNLIISIFRKKE